MCVSPHECSSIYFKNLKPNNGYIGGGGGGGGGGVVSVRNGNGYIGENQYALSYDQLLGFYNKWNKHVSNCACCQNDGKQVWDDEDYFKAYTGASRLMNVSSHVKYVY